MIIIIVAAAVLLLGGGGFAAWYFFFKDKAEDKSDKEPTEQLESEPADEGEDVPFIDIDEGEEVIDETDIPDPEPDFIGEEEEVEEPVANKKTVEKAKENKVKKETKTSDTAEKKALKTSKGTYTGPRQGGKAHGMGQFVFSRSMSIPLNDGYGTVINVEPGDRVYSAKFVDGRLRQGKFVFRDGREKFVMGINQEL